MSCLWADPWRKQASFSAAAAVETWHVWERAALLISAGADTVNLQHSCAWAAKDTSQAWAHQQKPAPNDSTSWTILSITNSDTAPSINKIQLQGH